jgi:hypothetical protein
MSNLIFNSEDVPNKAFVSAFCTTLANFNQSETKSKSTAANIEHLFNELIYRLSSQKDGNLNELEEELVSAQYDAGTMQQINDGIKNRYKKMYGELLTATDTCCNAVIQDYEGKRRNEMTDNFHYANDLPGERDLNECMQSGRADRLFKNENNTYRLPGEDIILYHPIVQIIGLSRVKECLLTDGQSLDDTNGEVKWQTYRDKTLNAINSLSNKLGNVKIADELLKESSPILRVFKDAINNVCEAIGMDPIFEQSKTQLYKAKLQRVTTNLMINNPTEPEPQSSNVLK